MSRQSSAEALRERLRAGDWPFSYRTLLAPMEGVTHAGLRALIASYGGVGVVCTEFVRITKSPLKRAFVSRQVVRAPEVALSVQVMGDDEANMALATDWVVAAGTDVVDINLGCPAPNAVRKGVGALMQERPEVLRRVVRAMRKRTGGPLSAKMRAGVATTAHAVETAQLLEAEGVDFITVHPRRVVDAYHGSADYRIIRDIKRSVAVPVVGNGDIWFAEDAIRLMRTTGCDAVMMGRPALRNPWIFRQLSELARGQAAYEPDGAALMQHVHRYLSATKTGSEKATLGLLKEQLRYLVKAVPDAPQASEWSRELMRERDLTGLLCRLESRFGALAASELDLGVCARAPNRLPTAPTPPKTAPCIGEGPSSAVPARPLLPDRC